MDKSFCEKIDRELLIEEYVRGKLTGALLQQFEEHLRECSTHTRAVYQETNLRNGVIEFARNQIRSRIHKDQIPRNNVRFVLLRYAAVLFVIVTVPLILYYQFRILQPQGNTIKEAISPVVAVDSSARTESKLEDKSKVQAPPAVSKRQAAVAAKKTKSPAAESESAAEAVEKNAILEMESVEPILPGAVSTLSPDSSHMQAQPAAPLTAEHNLADTEKSLDLKKSATVGGLARQTNLHQDMAHVSGMGAVSSALPDSINEQISVKQSTLTQCYVTRDTSCFIDVRFTISIQGMVEHVQITNSNLPDKNIEQCLVEKIKLWKFKPLRQQTVVIKKLHLKS